MSGQIAGESYFMLHSFLLGAFITFFYDLFRIFRRVVPHGILLLSLEDLIFWLLATGGIFTMLYYENNGAFRWFAVIGAGCGMFLYKKTLSRPLVKLTSGLMNRFLEWTWKLLWKVSVPFRYLAEKIAVFSGRAARRSAVWARVRRRQLKTRLTAWVIAIKMEIRNAENARNQKRKRQRRKAD